MKTAYNLTACPDWIDARFDPANPKALPDGIKWSASFPPPPIGCQLHVLINGIGLGIVTGYFIEHDWLGVYVRPSNPPAWWRKQMLESGRTRQDAMVFGSEIRLI